MSTVVSPVTVIAEVATNSASKKFVTVPVLEDIGIIKSAVPMRIRTVKAIAISLVAESCERFFIAGSNLYLLAYLRLVGVVIL